MDIKNIIAEKENGILTVTISREQYHNALNKQTVIELQHVIREAQTDANVKAILITGSGRKSFVSGADIKEFIGLSETDARHLSMLGQNTFKQIENSAKPTLAAINGFALGGGCELAMACHLRVASSNAIFGQPEVKLGIIAGYGGTQRLIQYIGKTKATELHLTGKNISAQEALKWGLVNYVVEPEQLLNASKALLNEIIVHSPKTIEAVIKSLNYYFDQHNAGFENEIEEFGKCFLTNDTKEGIQAFLEKRAPHFTGF